MKFELTFFCQRPTLLSEKKTLIVIIIIIFVDVYLHKIKIKSLYHYFMMFLR